MPVWQRVAGRYGKRLGYVVATFVFTAGVLGVLGARVFPVGPRSCVRRRSSASGTRACRCSRSPMLPDVISAEEQRTGQVRAGVFAGVWTAGETLGLALGPALYGLILAVGGYVSSAGTDGRPAVECGHRGGPRCRRSSPPCSRSPALPLLRRKELLRGCAMTAG